MRVFEGYRRSNGELKNPAVIIDANHSNSGKQFRQQIRIVEEVMQNRLYDADFKQIVKGFMIESFLVEGNQKHDIVFGQSITDPCLGSRTQGELFRARRPALFGGRGGDRPLPRLLRRRFRPSKGRGGLCGTSHRKFHPGGRTEKFRPSRTPRRAFRR